MTIVQTNSLPLPLETFTQPCAEQRKSLVEQTEEITVELLLESNDIQLFGNKLRFFFYNIVYLLQNGRQE